MSDSANLEQILAKLAEVYSTCRNYQDQGVSRESMPDESGQEHITEEFFTTVFDRDAKRFRFEFTAGNPHPRLDRGCVVWRNGASVKHWTRLSGIEAVEEIGLAIAGAVGNSGEPPFLIPNLLTPREVKGRGLFELNDLQIVGHEEFNDCIV